MDELISRQAAIDAIEFGITYAKAINMETCEVTIMFEKENKALEDAVTRIKQLPSAQPEQKKGKWLSTSDNNKKRCSECDVITLIAQYPFGKANFCPNCGAKMER